jgi:hypothetical protein
MDNFYFNLYLITYLLLCKNCFVLKNKQNHIVPNTFFTYQYIEQNYQTFQIHILVVVCNI